MSVNNEAKVKAFKEDVVVKYYERPKMSALAIFGTIICLASSTGLTVSGYPNAGQMFLVFGVVWIATMIATLLVDNKKALLIISLASTLVSFLWVEPIFVEAMEEIAVLTFQTMTDLMSSMPDVTTTVPVP